MSDLIPTNPTPTAVPWSPDMMTPETAAPAALSAPAQHFMPSQPPGQAVQYQAAPQYQAPQSVYEPAAAPQMAQPYAPQPLTHPHMQSGQYAPAPQPQQTPTPQYAPALQPVHHRQQSAPPQMAQAAAAVLSQHGAQPEYAQPGPPPPLPLPPQLQPAELGQPQKKSKSFIGNLLNRSSKPVQAVTNMEAPAKSGSLFNKNFVLGAVTGLVIGAFIVPMVLDMFVGDSAPAQTQAQAAPMPALDSTPIETTGDSFLDTALADSTP